MSELSPEAFLDLRLVRYFTAVAEHRNFGRAAEALHTTQPSLSRQIRRLERQLGARLLDRTPQGSRLTEAGAVFLPRAEALLRDAARAAAQVRAAARPARCTVGFTPGLIVTPAVHALRRRRPDAEIQATHVSWKEARDALVGHRVDALVTRLPFPADGLEVTVLYDEPRSVLVPAEHRLAGKESVTLDDIAGEPLPRMAGDPSWDAFWRFDPRPDGSRAPDGPVIEAIEDKVELVADGRALAISVAGLRSHALRSDIAEVALEGVEPCQVALVTRVGDRGRLVADFKEVARDRLTGPGR
ncbi:MULTISPECIES: LysR family transcriptional regulator [unclassified Streptomyces]|uniref:LysR family transcriptional regulator n=1 Tax=unclassified Streptomyces TaxID=2593676 RepID=UPI00278C8D67|nr:MULTISPECIES: LysR family transcriptional regulator [unclassified Streptomyces]